MARKIKHTPVPWTIQQGPRTALWGIDGRKVAATAAGHTFPADRTTAQARADAAFIYRAVNSHYALLSALKTLVAENRRYKTGYRVNSVILALERAEDAIAEAEGKT